MFETLELVEFKGIKKCEKPLTFSRFTLLIGGNNTGKSSILEALSFIPVPWPAYTSPILNENKIHIFRWLHRDERSLVYRYAGSGIVSCKLEGNLFRVRFTPTGPQELVINGQTIPPEIGPIIKTLDEKLTADEINAYTLLIPNNNEFVNRLIDSLASNWSRVEKTGAHVRLVRQFVTKVVKDRYTELTVRDHEIMLRKELHEDVAYIRLYDVGDGVERFLTVALWLEAIRPRVVLWDDLEAAAHPSLIRMVLKWLLSHRWQVIATTHSIDVLHEFVLAEPDDAKVIQLVKSPDDVLSWRELTLEELEELFNSGQDVRKLLRWK
jgi:hypothetical protein